MSLIRNRAPFLASGVLILLLPGCSPVRAGEGPVARLHLWHAALREGDLVKLLRLTARNSRAFLSRLPDRIDPESKPLRVMDLQEAGSKAIIKVRDPSPGAPVPEGDFVLVRENGEWRVDLLATAGRNLAEVPLPGPPTRLVPVPVSRGEARRARKALEAGFRRNQGSRGR